MQADYTWTLEVQCVRLPLGFCHEETENSVVLWGSKKMVNVLLLLQIGSLLVTRGVGPLTVEVPVLVKILVTVPLPIHPRCRLR